MLEDFVFKKFGELSKEAHRSVLDEIDSLKRWQTSNIATLQDRRQAVPLTFSDYFTVGRTDVKDRVHDGGDHCAGTFKWNDWNFTPVIRELAMYVASLRGSKHLGQVFVSRMEPGAKVDWHDDVCPYYDMHHRMQICLQAGRETTFYCEDQAVVMKEREMWSFRNVNAHAVINHGTTERIALVVDCLDPKLNNEVKT